VQLVSDERELHLLATPLNMAKKYLGMRGKNLNWAISTIAGTDFLLFGYGDFLPNP
jgi:hypothetical protein